MLAFHKAIEAGAEGIEFDVQRTKDGELVIIHDELALRCLGEDVFIKDIYWSELKQLDASLGFRREKGLSTYPKQRVPLLEEYLSAFQDRKLRSNLELKTSVFPYDNIETEILDMVKQYRQEENFFYSSFNHESIVRIQALDASAACAFLTESWLLEPAQYCKRFGVQAYHPCYQAVSKKIVEELKKENILLHVYTVNEKNPFLSLLAMGVDAVFTNEVEKALQWRKEASFTFRS